MENIQRMYYDRVVCFRRNGEYISGWFLRLCYGLHQGKSCHINDIQLDPICAEIKLHNEDTNETKQCYVMGGFHGVESCNSHHKPVISLAIIE